MQGKYYRELNEEIRSFLDQGTEEIVLKNVNGQRYLGDGLKRKPESDCEGTPGNDMAALWKSGDHCQRKLSGWNRQYYELAAM